MNYPLLGLLVQLLPQPLAYFMPLLRCAQKMYQVALPLALPFVQIDHLVIFGPPRWLKLPPGLLPFGFLDLIHILNHHILVQIALHLLLELQLGQPYLVQTLGSSSHLLSWYKAVWGFSQLQVLGV